MKKLSLNLNKKVIEQLDKHQAKKIIGGGYDDLLSIWGSNCNNSDPNRHKCCEPPPSQDAGACTSTGSVNYTAMPGTCCETAPCNPTTV